MGFFSTQKKDGTPLETFAEIKARQEAARVAKKQAKADAPKDPAKEAKAAAKALKHQVKVDRKRDAREAVGPVAVEVTDNLTRAAGGFNNTKAMRYRWRVYSATTGRTLKVGYAFTYKSAEDVAYAYARKVGVVTSATMGA